MDRALKTGKDVVKGSFWLFTGRAFSTLFLAGGTIFLGVFIGADDYGLYSIALILPITLLLFQDWGVGSAMTKFCALFIREKREKELQKLIKVALVFEGATASLLTIIALLMANFVASLLYSNNESAVFFITIASIVILPSSFLSTIQSIFIGFEKMKLYSILLVCQAVLQSILSILLVYLNYGAFGAILGYILSFIGAAMLALTLLHFKILKKLQNDHTSSIGLNVSQALRLLLSFGIPLGISNILGGISTQSHSFLKASFVNLAMIGNYKIAHNFTIMLSFITTPINTVLFPAYAKIDPYSERQVLKSIFKSSVKYVSLLLVPATMALMVLSKPLIGTIYADKWPYAPLFLSFGVIGNLFIVFGNVIISSLLTGLAKTNFLMKMQMLNIVVSLPLAFILIPLFGILGSIFAGFVAGIPTLIYSLHFLWKHYKLKADYRTSGKIFLASSMAALVTWSFLSFFSAAAWIILTIGATIFLTIYVIFCPLIGAVNQEDLSNLKLIFSTLGFISTLVNIPLNLMEWVLKLKRN